MSYREEDGQVVLTMSTDDYQLLLMMLGAATATGHVLSTKRALALVNRLNEGNPHFTPYQVNA